MANAALKQGRWNAFQQAYNDSFEATNADIGRRAALGAIAQTFRYLSGADTATFCKTCAFNWDKKGIKLCPTCRGGWTELIRFTCNQCDSNYVLCATCGRNRHHSRWAQCYECATARREKDGK